MPNVFTRDRRVLDEAHAQHTDLGLDHRAVFAARLRHELTRETHVVVGDHDPEPRRGCGSEPRPTPAAVVEPRSVERLIYYGHGMSGPAPRRPREYILPASASHGRR